MWHCPVPYMTSLSPPIAEGAGELPAALLPCPHHGEFTGFDRPPLTTDIKLICQMPCASSPHNAHPATNPVASQPCAKNGDLVHAVSLHPQGSQHKGCLEQPSPAQPWLSSAGSHCALGPMSHHGWCLLTGAVLSAHSPQHSKCSFPHPKNINHPLLF